MMASSMFDQVVEAYVKSVLNEEEKKNPSSVDMVANSLKEAILKDLRKDESILLSKEAKEDARSYKKTLIRKVKRTLIYETIFLAFLVGMIVNQATSFVPEKPYFAMGVIVVALIVCALLICAETGKD